MPDEAATGGRRRYFEDFAAGEVVELGRTRVTAPEIVAFARRVDPQPFHVDAAAARESIYGGLIASGLHTLGLFTRLFVEQVLNASVSLGSPGFERVQWPRPVRPGDTLRARYTILECRPSRSKPDRGIIRFRGELTNQRDEVVLILEAVNFLGRRPAARP